MTIKTLDNIEIITQPPSSLGSQLTEDCACIPAYNLAFPADNTNYLQIQQSLILSQSPHTYLQQITPSYSLALNLVGGNQIAVLNAGGRALLNHFINPHPVASTERLLPRIHPQDIHRHLARLSSLSLLEATNSIQKRNALLTEQTASTTDTLVAWMHVTNQCNLRCPYCYIHKTSDEMTLETGKQSVDAVIRSALIHQFKRVQLKYAGGEATLNFPLATALQVYAEEQAEQYDLSLESVVLSNGVLITDQMIDLLQEHRMKLMISLDGVGEAHDSQRPLINGRGSFKQVEKSLDKLIARQLLPNISITLSRRNLSGLPETIEYVLERNLPFSLNFYRENECSTDATGLRYANQEIIEAMLGGFKVVEKYLPRQSLLSTIVDRANLQQAHTRTCGVGQNYLVIDQKGQIAKCQMEIEKPVASIHAADPLALVNQDAAGIQNLRVEEKEGCRECEWRYWCAGGCPLLTYRATGRYDVKSPNCEIYKAIFPEVLRLEGLRILKYNGKLN